MGADSSKPNNNTRPNQATSGVTPGNSTNPFISQTYIRPASNQTKLFNSGATTQTSHLSRPTSYQQESTNTVHQPAAGASRVVNASEVRTTYNYSADQLRSVTNAERIYPNLDNTRNITTERPSNPPAFSRTATSVNSVTPGVPRPATSRNSVTPGVSRPATSGNSVAPEVSRPATSGNSVTPVVFRPATSGNSVTPEVFRPATSGKSFTPGVSRSATSGNSVTPGISRPSSSGNSVTHGVFTRSNHSAPPSAPEEHDLPLATNYSNRRQPAADGPRAMNRCPTCDQFFGETIYQCSSGHSACDVCKSTGRRCRECGGTVSDMRNFQVEKLVQEMKVECPNTADGCSFRLRQQNIAMHVRECIFREMDCPLAAVFGMCTWRGKRGDDMLRHFDERHPETRRVGVTDEGFLHRPWNDTRLVHLVNLNQSIFIVHIKVSEANGSLRMAVQNLGTRVGAAKWKYELHLYNKAEPRRKFTYVDSCTSDVDPIDDVLSELRCLVLPVPYVQGLVFNGRDERGSGRRRRWTGRSEGAKRQVWRRPRWTAATSAASQLDRLGDGSTYEAVRHDSPCTQLFTCSKLYLSN